MGLPVSGPIDVVLQLMDHQIIDVDGRMVANVDDLELTIWPDGTLAVTALLVGAAALVPRLSAGSGQVLRRRWHDLGVEQADRDVPGRIDLSLVREVSSQVELSVGREGVVRYERPEPEGAAVRRVTDLLGMTVEAPGAPEPERLGRLLDLRLEAEGYEPGDQVRVTSLFVGRGRPGANLGYDRHPDQGPWLLNRVVRWLHRHTRAVDVDAVERIDWDGDRVWLRSAASLQSPGT